MAASERRRYTWVILKPAHQYFGDSRAAKHPVYGGRFLCSNSQFGI